MGTGPLPNAGPWPPWSSALPIIFRVIFRNRWGSGLCLHFDNFVVGINYCEDQTAILNVLARHGWHRYVPLVQPPINGTPHDGSHPWYRPRHIVIALKGARYYNANPC